VDLARALDSGGGHCVPGEKMDRSLILTLLRKKAADQHYCEHPAIAIASLADTLTRLHGLVEDDDWDAIVCAGSLLWRARNGEIEGLLPVSDLIQRMRRD
jgi:hypothetical protein